MITKDQNLGPKNFIEAMIEGFPTLEKAIDHHRAHLKDYPIDARLNLQVLLNALGREEEAFAISNELTHLAPQDRRAQFNRGWHLLKRGQFQEGLSYLESGRVLKTYGNPPLASSRPLWAPERKKGESVLLSLEGGLGDEIIHVRAAQQLARDYQAKVIVACQPALASVFARIPEVSAVVQPEAALGVYHDAWLPGMSAPRILGLTYESLSGAPYLTADLEYVLKWQNRLEGRGTRKTKVGIRWSGNPQFEHQQLRLFPKEILHSLSTISGVQLYSFQRDHDLAELPPEIIDLSRELQTWEETAAALTQMDLVISSCTSVAHMAAALGKPTWVVVPVMPYYVWAREGERSPWYDSVRLFRQEKYGSWERVGKSLREKLQALIGQPTDFAEP